MEQEAVFKGYDPTIMRRLLRYAKPYMKYVIPAIVSLAIASAASLLQPVVVQWAVDRHIVPGSYRVPIELAGDERLDRIPTERRVEVGSYLYVPAEYANSLAGLQVAELQEEGVLSSDEYYVTPHSEASAAILTEAGIEVSPEDGAVVISLEDLESLDREARLAVRQVDVAGVYRLSIVFLVLLAVSLVSSFLQIYLTALTGQAVMRDLRLELFNHIVRQRLGYLQKHPVGRLVTRTTNDVETVNQLFTSVLVELIRDFAMMIGVVVTLFLVNARLAALTMLTLPPAIGLLLFFRLRAREAYRRVRVWVSRVNTFLSEHLSGMGIVQLFVREGRTRTRFRRRNSALMKANLGELYVIAVFRPLIDLLSTASVAAIIYFGASSYMSGFVSLGVLIAFTNLIRQFYQPVMNISEKFTILQSAMAGGERVFQLLDGADRIANTGATHLPNPVRGEVEFDHVRFGYNPDEPVLHDLSFRVAPGETVAVVGYTGAGKTTIANLLTRLWDIDGGAIRVDGVDIRDVPLKELREAIQPIQQDVFLFSDTIRENILLGLERDDAYVEQSSRAVQAHQFLSQKEAGYDTMLNPGATNISTGQRQLLSFARVIAHDPRILILDEATSSVDTETERLIQLAVDELLHDRTALVIAHRLSTIKNADRILVLADGRLMEEGTHDELLKREGFYFNLYKLQYQEG